LFLKISSIFADNCTYDIIPIVKNSKNKRDLEGEIKYEQNHAIFKRQSSIEFGLDYMSIFFNVFLLIKFQFFFILQVLQNKQDESQT
jgi:hypothetical protein